MNILDIFYNQIVPEAASGHIECYFRYNMPFNTLMEGNLLKANEVDNTLIPTLTIKNKDIFDSLLIEYVKNALQFYDFSLFPAEINEIVGEKEKNILALLWSNATNEDFLDPINFLNKRISFLKDNSLKEIVDQLTDFESQILKSRIEVCLEKSKLPNETPYKLKIILHSLESNDTYELPSIYVGIYDNKAYIYAIQNDSKIQINNSYQKKIKRLLYGIDQGLDVLNETKENYDFGNLKDVTPSFIVATNILMSILNKMEIDEIIIPSLLVPRWNAKEMAINYREEARKIDELKARELREEHEFIQSNLSEKLIRTFLRLAYHHSGINITSYPMEIDSALHIKTSRENTCNNPILDEIYKALDSKKR